MASKATTPATIRILRKCDFGLRSVVELQIDWALPPGRLSRGKSGESFIVLVAAVIRLSQNTSRAFELSAPGLGFRVRLFRCAGVCGLLGVPGRDRLLVVGKSQNSADVSRRTRASSGEAAI